MGFADDPVQETLDDYRPMPGPVRMAIADGNGYRSGFPYRSVRAVNATPSLM
ncbi:hypothetical protein [Streptomyces sp. NPDC005827]|uniref:hypothetical protein n=1 Tax=Streptomyces sp. NPDC005827 TaxID=3157070 RepID=UPI0034118D59